MPSLAAVKAAARMAWGRVGQTAWEGVDVQHAAVREHEFVGAVFEVFGGDFLAVPTAGEHALAVLAVGEDVAVDLEPHGFVGGGFVGVDVEEQFGSFGLGRGDVEFDFCAESGREFLADVAVNAHFVGDHIGGGEAGGAGGLGVDEAVAAIVAEVGGGNLFHGRLLGGGLCGECRG